MPGAKEIRSKIGSVKNTQKITRAMEMVAASKIRRTQARHDRSPAVRRRHSQNRQPSLPRAPRLHAAVPSRTRGEVGRLHPHLHRPRPLRRPQREPVPALSRRAPAAGRCRRAHADRSDRGQGGAVLPQPRREHHGRGLAPRREAAHRGSGQRRARAAGGVSRGTDRPHVPGPQPVREHHAPAAGDPATASGVAGKGRTPWPRTGTTSTNRPRASCSTGCWSATSRRRCSAPPWRTWPAKWPPRWWR